MVGKLDNSRNVPIEYLRERLYINDDWKLVWKERPLSHFKNKQLCASWNSNWSGELAGGLRHGTYTQYLTLYINGKTYYNHRIIWAIYYNYYSEWLIDHIDGDGTNNHISNLRECDPEVVDNTHNKRISKANTSGKVGVSYQKNNNKWVAFGRNKGTRYFLGSFDKFEDACRVRLKWEKEHGYIVRGETLDENNSQ